jgi:hypothetical protein
MELRRRELFTTIRTEGAILPPDLLQRVASGDSDLGGLKPVDYHLFEGEPLNEAIVRSWNRLVGAWAAFSDARTRLPEGDLGTTITRERWLLILFDELGYGRLQPARAVEIDGKSYAASHSWGEQVPIHLVGCNVSIGTKARGVAGAAAMSPHGLLQELLNRSEERLWGFVSNGLTLRVLRDNSSLTRQACVEFDLASMMDGEVYADFVILWLVCHQSRVEGEIPHECWLERWSQEAVKQGTRALDGLRSGVEAAITALGNGFLAHPANTGLRDALRSGAIDRQDYYRELLRLVYRLLFLFVAEDRGLLLSPDAKPEAAARYGSYYSTQRLRRLADRRRGSKHTDLYEGLRVVMDKLGEDDGCPELGLPALGSYLWSEDTVRHLNGAQLANSALLDTVRALSTIEERGVRRAVDYRNLGAEELGSVYESLLELQPTINVDAAAFSLGAVGGNERRATGSYYTPTSLIASLLDISLDPLLHELVQGPDPESALLELKVIDPACGSGHFLVAAAHRIAKRLAAVRTGDDEPSPEATRTALRDVVSHCIYGVDVNPMAVELCQVSLWIEALEPGKPLGFLAGHVQCGNAVVGTSRALVNLGIPDGAFEAIDDDADRAAVVSAQRKANAAERLGQSTLDFAGSATDDSPVHALIAVEELPETTAREVEAKEAAFAAAHETAALARERLARDAWCAAFFSPKRAGVPPLTTDVVRRLAEGKGGVSSETQDLIGDQRAEHRFFHWDLAFPAVFSRDTPGFDLLLGNPPWKSLSPDLKEFFEPHAPEIRTAKKTDQEAIVARLLADNEGLSGRWRSYRRYLLVLARRFFRKSGRYELFAPGNLGKGDQNIYRMFIETALQITAPNGYAAQVLPSNLYNGANAAAIRRELLEHWDLQWVLGFINENEHWFNGIDESTKFTIYSARRRRPQSELHIGFRIQSDQELHAAVDRRRTIDRDTIRQEAPDTLAIPETADSGLDAVASKMLAAWLRFGEEIEGLPYRHYQAEIHMGNDRDLFVDGLTDDGLPVFEGRMVDQYDYRAKAYVSGRGRAARWDDLPFGSPGKRIVPQWRVPRDRVPTKLGDLPQRYRIAWNDVASPERGRSLKASLIPPSSICGHKVPTFTYREGDTWQYMPWLAAANSLCLDALARRLISLSMSINVMDSLPFPRWDAETALALELGTRALRLSCTGPEMVSYWNSMAERGWVEATSDTEIPGAAIDPGLRERLRIEIEALVAYDMFGLTRPEFEIVIDSFEHLAASEVREHGEFRTRRLALEAFDAVSAGAKDDTREPSGTTDGGLVRSASSTVAG